MLAQPKNIFSFFSIRKNVWLLALLISLHATFFIYAYNTGNIYLAVDSTEYLNQAKNFTTHGSWYAGDWDKPHDAFLETRRPPLYALFICLLRFFSSSDFFVLLMQNILSIVSVFISMGIAQLLIEKKTNQLIPFLFLLFFPTQLIYANMIMADLLFQFLLVCSVYYFVRFLTQQQTKHFFIFNFILALAVLTKPVLYWFWILVFLIAIIMWSKSLLKLVHTGFVLLPLVAVLLLSFYNHNKTGYFHYSSVNQKFISEYGAYLAVGNRGDSVAQQKVDSILLIAHEQSSFKEYAIYLNRESVALIKTNLPNFLWMQTKGMISFFIDHGRWDLFTFFVQPDFNQQKGIKYFYETDGVEGAIIYIKTFNPLLILYLLMIVVANIFLLFCFFQFISNREINIWARILILSLVVYMVLFTGVVGCSRYRMAVYPFLLIAALVVSKIKTEQRQNGVIGLLRKKSTLR